MVEQKEPQDVPGSKDDALAQTDHLKCKWKMYENVSRCLGRTLFAFGHVWTMLKNATCDYSCIQVGWLLILCIPNGILPPQFPRKWRPSHVLFMF